VSDAGEDFSILEKEFPFHIIYKYESKNVKVGYWKNKEECAEWFRRVKNACEVLTSDNIIILEEDVLINRDMTTMPLLYALCGPRGHTSNYINYRVEEFINKHGIRKGEYKIYGGCGGSVFNKEIFLKTYDWYIPFLMKWYNYLDEISHTLIRHQDYCLTLMFNLAGYPYGPNPVYTEPLYGIEFENWNNKTIIHHFDEISK
jgi:hypothetical protein